MISTGPTATSGTATLIARKTSPETWTLIRVTSERALWPRQLVRAVYQALRANGYDGPAPEFGELWVSLFG